MSPNARTSYHIRHLLHRGRNAVVYEATGYDCPPPEQEGEGLRPPVHAVVKQMLRPEQTEALWNALNVMSQGDRCPYVAPLLDLVEGEGERFVVSQYVDGHTLDKHVAAFGGLPEREALQCLEQLCEGVRFLHHQGLLHLDLKPLNVVRRDDGHLFIIDFDSLSTLTNIRERQNEGIAFSIAYSAPEVVSGSKFAHIGFPADVYSLGATLYALLTNQTPPSIAYLSDVGFPTEVLERRGVSAPTVELVRRCLSLSWRKRPQTVQSLLLAVRKCLDPALPMGETAEDDVDEAVGTAAPLVEESAVDKEKTMASTAFSPVWHPDITPQQKAAVSFLLENMHVVSEQTVSHGTETGVEKETYNVFGFNDVVKQGIYAAIMGREDGPTDAPNEPVLLPVNDIVRFFSQLERLTGLPFRLASPTEHACTRSAAMAWWEQTPVVFYDEERGFGYYDLNALSAAVEEKECLTPEEKAACFCTLNRTPYDGPLAFAFEVVCERTSPVLLPDGVFNLPWTQQPAEALEPLGFGYYKMQENGLWRVTTPALTPTNLLQTVYEQISPIGLYSLPSREKERPKFIGLQAETADRVALYVLYRGRLNRILDLSRKDWEERLGR